MFVQHHGAHKQHIKTFKAKNIMRGQYRVQRVHKILYFLFAMPSN
jgi:hypothetical protein